MISTIEEFEAAYANASLAQKYLCSRSGDRLWSIATKHGITDPGRYSKFAQIVGDTILGIQKIPDLHVIISKEISLDEMGANKITRDLLDFLAPLSDPSWQPPKDDHFSEPLRTVSNPVSVDIAETEALLNTIDQSRTIRTMPAGAGNTSAEKIYTSTQSAILEEGRLKSQSTPTTPGAAPRWDSAK